MRTIINTFLAIILSLISLKISVSVDVRNTLPLQNNISNTFYKVDGTQIVNNSKNLINISKNKNNDEKIHQTNKIAKIWIGSDGLLNVIAEIKNNKEEVKISIYNVLGKEIRKVYQGSPLEKDSEGYYKFTSSNQLNIPNNIYILVIQGVSYKIADKFIISNR